MENKIRAWKRAILFTSILLSVSILYNEGRASDVPKGLPRSGDIIPAFSVPVPKTKAHRSYLDLEKEDTFQPAELQVQMVIIEVLNLY